MFSPLPDLTFGAEDLMLILLIVIYSYQAGEKVIRLCPCERRTE
jgi:hypothetical protein